MKENGKLSSVGVRILEVVMDNMELKQLSLEAELKLLGMDSITFIKIVVAIEDEFGFEFEDEMLLSEKFPTVIALIDYVENMINPESKI